ncbi:MAG: glutamate racemase [Bacteroidales bacterium]|nr:glutamate racemase [Bacteroidales bacterium]
MIGLFDSGAGGLSVWKELLKIMPSEDYFYISDAAYCPYGPKSKEMILKRATAISQFLIERGAEIIVVACNTATAAAISDLRQLFDIPFVGMEPAVKPAAALTKTGVIGVLATQGTFKGQLYLTTSEKYARRKQVKIIERVGEGLVELVESGNTDSPEAEALVKKYIDPMVEEGADCVVLGCTHYPFLEKVIRRVASDSLQIINPAPAVARRARNLLEKARKSRVYASSSERQLKKEHRITVATTGSHTDVLRKLTAGVVEEIKYQGLLNESQIDSLGQIFFVSLEI